MLPYARAGLARGGSAPRLARQGGALPTAPCVAVGRAAEIERELSTIVSVI